MIQKHNTKTTKLKLWKKITSSQIDVVYFEKTLKILYILMHVATWLPSISCRSQHILSSYYKLMTAKGVQFTHFKL